MDLTPEEMLLAAVLRRALKDARDARNEKLRAEASAFVWQVAPTVAKRAGVVKTVGDTPPLFATR